MSQPGFACPAQAIQPACSVAAGAARAAAKAVTAAVAVTAKAAMTAVAVTATPVRIAAVEVVLSAVGANHEAEVAPDRVPPPADGPQSGEVALATVGAAVLSAVAAVAVVVGVVAIDVAVVIVVDQMSIAWSRVARLLYHLGACRVAVMGGM